MVLGHNENFNGRGLVAFIDILGFAKEIDKKWGNLEDNPLEKLLQLKQKLPIIPSSVFKENDKTSKSKLFPCRVQTISDSIIVSFGFDEPFIHGDIILASVAFFYTISEIWKRSIELGYTVRGAMDLGQIFWNEKEIIGPAFLHVYRLEQNQAKTSRIIVSPSLNNILADYLNKGTTLWDDNLLKMLRKDIDGYIIFNPHSLYLDYGKKDLIAKLEEIRDKSEGLEKEKYIPLLAILNTDNYPLKISELGKY